MGAKMDNIEKLNPGVKVMLDRERTYRLDMRAIIAFTEKTGKSFLKGINYSELKESELVALIWCGFLTEDHDLQYDDVLDLLTAERVKALLPQIFGAINKSTPEVKVTTPLVEINPKNQTS
jgi:hypothetical protein